MKLSRRVCTPAVPVWASIMRFSTVSYTHLDVYKRQAFCWAFFFLMNLGMDLLWNRAPAFLESAGCPALFYPIVFCTLGGLAIGLFQKRVGPYPDDMNTVLAEVKSSGRYEYKHIKAMFLGALIPLMFVCRLYTSRCV